MQVNYTPGCCSLLTISNNPDFTNMNKLKFHLMLKSAIENVYIKRNEMNLQYFSSSKTKSIMMYTNIGWADYFDQRWGMFKCGFRQIGSYQGNGDKVYIMQYTPKPNLGFLIN